MQKRLLDHLLSSIKDDAPVREVLVGLHWTVVCSRGCGLAATYTAEHWHDHRPAEPASASTSRRADWEVGSLHKKTALELAGYARAADPLAASIGVAALNSLLSIDERLVVEINAAEVLAERGRGKQVALVGHFHFIPELEEAAKKLWVLELHPREGEYPAEAAPDLIPQAEVVAITGSALINHTLEGLLALCKPGALVMVLGPSTPLSPVLFEYGVTLLSGAQVIDEAALLRTVAQGAGFRQVEGVRLVTMARPDPTG